MPIQKRFSYRFVRNTGLIVLGAFIVLSCLFSYFILGRISNNFKTVSENQLPSLNAVIHIQSEFSKTYPHFQKFLNEQSDQYLNITTHLENCQVSLLQMGQHASPREKARIEKLVKIIKQLKFALKTNRKFVLDDPASSNAQELATIINEKMDDANSLLNDISAMIQGRIRISEKAFISQVTFNKRLLMIFLGMAILTSLGMIMVFNRALSRPINSLMQAAEKIASGDLEFQMKKVGNDEFGQLVQSFNNMTQKLVQNRTVELKEINDNLRKEIEDRKRAQEELKAFAAKLEQSNRELQDLTFVASHDLREPLRKITVFGDWLKTSLSDKLDAKSLDNLARMEGAVQQMHVLMDGLLKITRVTTKAKPFASVDLNDLVGEVASELEVRLGQSGGSVEVDALPTIEADPAQMRQLFNHLIGNALKFRRKDEPPQVRISAHSFKGKRITDSPYHELCRISIEDNGIGFDEKYLDRIFGVFQQLHNRREYEGVGMGLAICRKIVERHNGSITANSVVGQGTTLIIQLPVKQPDLEVGSLEKTPAAFESRSA